MGLNTTVASLSSSGFPVRVHSPWELLLESGLGHENVTAYFCGYERAVINILVCMENNSPRRSL